jgi:hypothetical protein
MADYFGHWLKVGSAAKPENLPQIFFVNWFRRDTDGRFLWPGYGENSRVLKWVFERLDGTAGAVETPIGNLPVVSDLDTSGLKVDADGKITSQGKAVDKVLVDGDEFFGGDATVATKNLAASSIESVQVYEKKSDDVANSSTGEETQKVLNLKLKDEAKKGYFGKISGASDFQKFHEGEVLVNYFKKKLKISVFGLGSSTPNASFGWGDVYKYGLNNEFDSEENEDGGMFMSYSTSQPQGIPLTFKSGFYYTDKLSKNTKLNINYSYNSNEVVSKTAKNSQYFLTDTTYTSANETQAKQKNEAHAINIGLLS